jgi:UDP-glucuronate 4-epimerase
VPTILITGSAGFIGSHVAQALAARGDKPVGLDNFDPFYPRAAKERNLAESGQTEVAVADIGDAGALRDAFKQFRPEGVIHLAAKAGVRPSIADPVGYARANVLGTAAVLDAAQRAGCSRIVIASSSSVYGNNEKTPFAEDDRVDHPISPYAATKKACELIAHSHALLTKMPTACLRFFTVFGPRQRPDLAIASFMRRIAHGQEIQVFGDGSMSRDFTFIDDIVGGIIAAYDRVPEHGYRIWNLGSDRPIRLDDMVAAIARTVGHEPRIRRMPVQPGDVERTWADLSRSRAELNYAPRTPFEEGLARQWEWLRESGELERQDA